MLLPPLLPLVAANVAAALATSFAVSTSAADDQFGFQNINNEAGADIYVATLSINGHDFEVQLDTGSSDLWLDTTNFDLSHLENTGLQTGITYGDGTVAEGPIIIADVSLGDFTVSQAFISAPGSNATTNDDTGLLGLGPPLLSTMAVTLDGTRFNGKSLLENIFDADPSEPNITTFLLSRSEATGTTDGGIFTIGEIASNMTQINGTIQYEVKVDDRWIIYLDGIIVNGQSIDGYSAFALPDQRPGQTLANLDSGTGLAQIPPYYMDAIYASVPGAQLLSEQGYYIVPCDAQIKLSFVFGGVEFPIHPIDTVIATSDGAGGVVCVSGFPAGESTNEDFLLGDSFLRNVYSLYNFGSFISPDGPPPFIQLLSVTNPDNVSAEFMTLSAARNASIINQGTSAIPSSSVGAGNNGGHRIHHKSNTSIWVVAMIFSLLAFL